MLTLRINDEAVRLLGLLDGVCLTPPGGLASGLKARAACGVQRHGKALKWADWIGEDAGAVDDYPDLTGWECANSAMRLEDLVDIPSSYLDFDVPLSEDDQRILLRQGLALTLEFGHCDLPAPVRCIISANDTHAIFRFHQIRPGERWSGSGQNLAVPDKVIEVDIDPSGHTK